MNAKLLATLRAWGDSTDPILRAHAERRLAIEAEPSLLQKGINFAKATANHLAEGLPTAPPEEVDRRLQICRSCELMTAEQTCRHPQCGCRLKIKATWLDQKCPAGKW